MIKFNDLNPKTDGTGKTYWKEIGNLVMNDDGQSGTLYLHMYDTPFIIRPDDRGSPPKPKKTPSYDDIEVPF